MSSINLKFTPATVNSIELTLTLPELQGLYALMRWHIAGGVMDDNHLSSIYQTIKNGAGYVLDESTRLKNVHADRSVIGYDGQGSVPFTADNHPVIDEYAPSRGVKL